MQLGESGAGDEESSEGMSRGSAATPADPPGAGGEEEAKPEDATESAAPSPPDVGPGKHKATRRASAKASVSLWRDIAGVHLSEMASSLEGAVHSLEGGSDAKLRALFDKLDLDAGGTISMDELQVAIKAAGRELTEEQAKLMLTVADGDGVRARANLEPNAQGPVPQARREKPSRTSPDAPLTRARPRVSRRAPHTCLRCDVNATR